MANNLMNHKLLKKMITSEIKAAITEGKEPDFSTLIEGSHGIGKSAFITELCLEYDGFLIDLRLGQRDLGDVLGFPQIVELPTGKKIFTHIKPELVKSAFVNDLSELGIQGDNKDVLSKYRDKSKIGTSYQFIAFFADEYNRGTKDVQQAMFELVYDRRMSGEKVHPRCFIFAACNDNLEIYTVTEGDPAFRSRFKSIKYAPTVEEWLSWGKQTNEICEEILQIISFKKDLLDPPKGKDLDFLNQPHPNRRSWHHFSKYYTAFKNNFTELEMRNICATFVGGDAAEVFRLLVEKIKSSKTQHDQNVLIENDKIKNFYDNFIRHHKWNEDVAKANLDTFNISETQALGDYCIEQFSKYKYMTGVTKDKIKSFSKIISPEIFAKIWKNVSSTYQFRIKMKAHIASTDAPNYFEIFEL